MGRNEERGGTWKEGDGDKKVYGEDGGDGGRRGKWKEKEEEGDGEAGGGRGGIMTAAGNVTGTGQAGWAKGSGRRS